MVFDIVKNEYHWKNSKDIETTLMQDQGLDLLILQRRKSHQKTISFYSDPGTALFAALLNFHLTRHGLLPLKEQIQTVPLSDGDLYYNHLEDRLPEEPLNYLSTRHWLDQNIPRRVVARKLTLAEGEWEGEIGLHLFAYENKAQLVIARSFNSTKKKTGLQIGVIINGKWVASYNPGVVWKSRIRFDAEDTLDALRGIYGLASGNALREMNGLYQIASQKVSEKFDPGITQHL